MQASARSILIRAKNGIVNFKIKDLKARTLFITLGILVAVIIIPTGASYLPQNQNSTAPGQSTQEDFINTAPAAVAACSTLDAGTCKTRADCTYNDPGFGGSGACEAKACSTIEDGT